MTVGFLYLLNATPYVWKSTCNHTYQVDQWAFPQTLSPGDSINVAVDIGGGADHRDSAAEICYSVVNPGKTDFQIQYRIDQDSGDPNFWVELDGIFTSGFAKGSRYPIGWVKEAATPFILSGTNGFFASKPMPTAWMQSRYSEIGCLPLRHLCMPGSHDAGMSSINHPTSGAGKADTQTQNLDIAGQLAQGARYFDIRPVVAQGDYRAGHYSQVLGAWQGATGQTISEIVQQINDYLATNHELVVIELTADHMYDTDNGYAFFDANQWTGLFKLMSGLKNLYVAPTGTTDLTRLSLNTFIAKSGAVIVVVRGYNDLGSYAGKGFYIDSQYPIYNEYSDTDSADKMINDQEAKMIAQRPSPDSTPFLLSWTLTQAFKDITEAGSSIIDLAQQVLPDLYGSDYTIYLDKGYLDTDGIWKSMSKNTYPNVILIDAWPLDQRVTDFCMAINRYFTTSCNGH